MTFGSVSYQHIISLIATDVSESQEFLTLIPVKHYILTLCIPLSLIFFRRTILKYNLNPYRNRGLIICSVIFFSLQLPPLSFFTNFSKASKEVYKELNILNNTKINNEWGKTTRRNDLKHYDNYVLIIGESARRDYHHLYGYPINNTPFLDKTNGIFIDGLITPDGYTIGSLKRMLTLTNTTNWKENYNLNLIDLIKSSNIKTFWLSNQGYIGEFDTPITALAKRSDVTYFLKSGSYDSLNSSDFSLLPEFQKLISQKSDEARFFILHIYGSHPYSCERLTDYHSIFPKNDVKKQYRSLNCYISTIKKTDAFIEQVVNILKQNQQETHQSYSIVYFSDHGLSHSNEKDIDMNNNQKGKYHYNVPLVKISSDDTEHQQYKVFKSGLTFTNGIAHWLAISNPKLDPDRDLFSNQSDLNDYGQKEKIEQLNLDDPAIDIRQ